MLASETQREHIEEAKKLLKLANNQPLIIDIILDRLVTLAVRSNNAQGDAGRGEPRSHWDSEELQKKFNHLKEELDMKFDVAKEGLKKEFDLLQEEQGRGFEVEKTKLQRQFKSEKRELQNQVNNAKEHETKLKEEVQRQLALVRELNIEIGMLEMQLDNERDQYRMDVYTMREGMERQFNLEKKELTRELGLENVMLECQIDHERNEHMMELNAMREEMQRQFDKEREKGLEVEQTKVKLEETKLEKAKRKRKSKSKKRELQNHIDCERKTKLGAGEEEEVVVQFRLGMEEIQGA